MLLAVSLAGLFLSFAGNVSALTADTEETILSPFNTKTKIYTGEKDGEAFGDGSASIPLFGGNNKFR